MRPVYKTRDAGVKTVNNRHQRQTVFKIFKCPEELSRITPQDLHGGNNRSKTRTPNSYNKNISLVFGTFFCIISFAKGGRKKKREEGKRGSFHSPNFSLSMRPSYHHTFQNDFRTKGQTLTRKKQTNKTPLHPLQSVLPFFLATVVILLLLV